MMKKIVTNKYVMGPFIQCNIASKTNQCDQITGST